MPAGSVNKILRLANVRLRGQVKRMRIDLDKSKEQLAEVRNACAEEASAAVRRHGGLMLETGDCLWLAEIVGRCVAQAKLDEDRQG